MPVDSHLCTTKGVLVLLEWKDVKGKAVNRTCSLQSQCSRHMKQAHLPQHVGDEPIAACILLLRSE